MIDADFTLASPMPGTRASGVALLALTIVWHPDLSTVGAQWLDAVVHSGLDVNRYTPLFSHPAEVGFPLAYGGISRQSVRFVRTGEAGITMVLPATPMVVEVNGRLVTEAVTFDADQMADGQIVTLGRAVVLCLHWMDRLPTRNPVPGMIGVGNAAIAVREQIRLVASTDLPVLLLGETGTGKEVAARGIHALGRRAGAPLVNVNMAALNESLAGADLFGAAKGAYTGALSQRDGLFAQANGATLFLDEIGNAPACVQPMLLRVLEDGHYRPLGVSQDRHTTARLIAATDQNLDATGFNQALLRRLEGFVIQLPPLRARREDIGVLILHMLRREGAVPALPVALVADMAAFNWPGNVRQLANVLRRAVLLVQSGATPTLGQLVLRGLPAQLVPDSAPAHKDAASAGLSGRRKPAGLSTGEVLDAMERHAWTIQAAALALGVSRPSLYKLLDTHPEIRRAEMIPDAEVEAVMARTGGDVALGASLLKTPVEALRRRWRFLRSA